MSERGALRARLELLAREVAKFGVVGAVGLVVNIVVSNLLWRYTDIPTVRAGLLATVVAILGNYIGFRYWTYRDRDKSGRTRELTLFLLFSAVGAVIETGVLYTATYGFGWNSPVQSNVFKILGIGIATLFRFWSYRTWVFKALPIEKAAPDEAVPGGDVPGDAVPDGTLPDRGVPGAGAFLKQGRTEQVPRVEADSVRR
ncbi:GtrA family protein [Streptomyces sp. NPDC048161]|jgi:putative flippase GtrA|uniref:GtrA family protein n=1 Tax=unclassified Streptomyces TaxID=2593676 RepID=UPI00081B01BF|nr:MULTISPECIES: GtrA family protein [unclassified Streptomyces]SCD62858.1 Putative flippase GtrA (transmembrane translocase of bactoprenol-linked glucose) [Streptomyces sp. DvalAA-43]